MRSITFIFLAALSTPAFAQDAASARAHYQKATNHFAVGEFNEAGEEYQEAYKLKPDAALLFNAAQAFRLGGNNEKALVLYRNYLNLYPKARNADEVREQIHKLEEAIEAQRRAKQPPTNTMDPQGTQSQQAQTQTSQKPDKPIHKKWWFWTALAGAVVVAAGVVTVAVVLTRPEATPWNDLPTVGPKAMGLGIGGTF